MNSAEQYREEMRVKMFDREFPKIAAREHYLTMYLQLRDGGDSHSDAVTTIKAERMVAGQHNPR